MNCECEYCKNDLPFDMPKEVVDAAMSGELVVFAGAGISTESKLVFKQTLYEDVLGDLNIKSTDIDFPSAMTEFCKQKNGRKLLLEKIRNRFEYCRQFGELYRVSTHFHTELSSIYSIDKIVTTNWDDYFERECNATPIVTAEDFAFYNIESRKIFKIHGSISNYGSIVATTSDYKKCYKNLQNGVIGGYLKTLLATKIVVFVGFSFSDFDFNKIYNYLKKEMGEIIPHCYIVTIDQNFKNKVDVNKVTVINTSGQFFFSVLRKHLEGIKFLLPKENIESVEMLMYLRSEIHKHSSNYFLKNKTPTAIYNLFYQDGMKHAFDYLMFHTKSGTTYNPHHILSSIEAYDDLKRRALKAKNYPDYVYIEGYITGLYSILLREADDNFPFYYIMGIGPINTFKEFEKYMRRKKVYHKTADIIGKKYFKDILDKNASVVAHHTAFIG